LPSQNQRLPGRGKKPKPKINKGSSNILTALERIRILVTASPEPLKAWLKPINRNIKREDKIYF